MNADDPRRFPQYDQKQLEDAIEDLNKRIVVLQKQKDRKLRGKLPQMQSDLHAMRQEWKRRKVAALRERWNQPA